ncbi:hypothetical protein ACFX5Q_15745 [Mesorhizobium sp. IMUNJ 23033]|uniref:COG3904 family protein n=1 Tax=Mesorhizobium sp. IMUNJ 23033 TaxID=3378039 RepID=UPI00384CB19B
MVPGHRLNNQAWWSLGLVCLVSLFVMGHAALAADARESDLGPPMRFVVVRSNAPGCEPTCPEWISAEGTIEAGTPALLRRALKKLGGRKLPVVVDSPGGNVDAALALGRLIRKNKLDIAVGKTRFKGCLPDEKDCTENDGRGARYFGTAYADGSICNSACPLMFSGGVRRVVGQWAFLGVHQITTTYVKTKLQYRTTYRVVKGKKKIIGTKVVSRKSAGSYKTYEMSKAVEKRLAAYLKEMGVGQGVLTTMKNTPASGIHQLVPENMLRMNLVTSLDSVDLFTAGTICSANPLPANCREIPANKPATPTLPTVEAPTAGSEPAEVPPAQPEIAQREQDMRFVVVRGSNPLCNPDCPEWISAEGAITPQTPQKLRQLLATLGNRRLPVVISSRGGDLFSALAAGRLIHEKKLDVAVARTDFVGCDPAKADCPADDGAYAGLSIDAGAECDSACALMLAGGARRFVGPQARLSLHLMGQKQVVKTYLEEMAVGPGLFTAIERRSVERQLEPGMMLKVGLTTGPQSVDALTGATICKASPKPDNCRMVPSPNAQADAPARL